ncbi:hypothetical protein L2E82_36895 [Cichorium intybus]|uniref:Uncharacterized protein n=1 Tax=Cichorium intybus TaxID=13427 RepID=A0ACB9AEA6_CICIN|nr:hypothetical protein L2E82_36895 [Cichorium intybus]
MQLKLLRNATQIRHKCKPKLKNNPYATTAKTSPNFNPLPNNSHLPSLSDPISSSNYPSSSSPPPPSCILPSAIAHRKPTKSSQICENPSAIDHRNLVGRKHA